MRNYMVLQVPDLTKLTILADFFMFDKNVLIQGTFLFLKTFIIRSNLILRVLCLVWKI